MFGHHIGSPGGEVAPAVIGAGYGRQLGECGFFFVPDEFEQDVAFLVAVEDELGRGGFGDVVALEPVFYVRSLFGNGAAAIGVDQGHEGFQDIIVAEAEVGGHPGVFNGDMSDSSDMEAIASADAKPTPPDMSSTDSTGGMQAPPDMGSKGGNPDTQSSTASNDEETYINISGGTITIINETGNDADGLDSNGDIIISGGTIYVSLQGSGSNSAVDYGSESGGVAEISGGTIIACGASSMAEAFDSSSTQASLLYNTSTISEAGTTLAIEDIDGNVLLSWEVPCSFSSALVSCPQMETGETYTVVIGENEETITLEEVSASYGEAQSSMFGGNMNWGGMQRRGGRGENTSTGSTDTTAIPSDMPDMRQDGSTDALSEQTPPDMSDMSQNGAAGFTADRPSDMTQGKMTSGPMQKQQEQSQQEEDQADEAISSTKLLDARTWGILGGCTALLLAGIAVSKFYKKH